MQIDQLVAQVDRLSRAYFKAQSYVIGQVSGSIAGDTLALLAEVNRERSEAGLPQIPLPNHMAFMVDE